MKDFDVIVIGSGIGGLIGAGILASQGLSLLLVEKNKSPGGYLSSFKRGAFVFDSAVDCISGVGTDGLIASVLKSLGVDNEIDFVRVNPIRVSIFPDREVAVDSDVNAYIDRLITMFPSEASGIRGFFALADRAYGTISLISKPPMYRSAGPDRISPDLVRLWDITYEELLNEFLKDYRLKAILSDRCPFIGLSPSKVAALPMIMLIMSYFRLGAYRPAGGSQRLSDVLVEGIKKNRGRVIFGSCVKKILVDGRNCIGIVCDDGEEYTSRHIISNADFTHTFTNLLGDKYVSIAKEMLRNPGVSTSFFLVYAGVKGEFEGHSSTGYFPSYDIINFFKPEAVLKENGTLGITVASLEDRLRAPDGYHTVVFHEMVEADGQTFDKPACTDKVLKKAESIIPGIRGRIEVLDSATPQTLRRYTGNFHGSAFGWKQVPGFRNMKRHGINNLYIAGHWGETGGGVLAAAYSGARAAGEILMKEGIKN